MFIANKIYILRQKNMFAVEYWMVHILNTNKCNIYTTYAMKLQNTQLYKQIKFIDK